MTPRLEVALADITAEQVDAVVNAANTSLLGGGGVDGALHRAAGHELLEACRRLGGCAFGDAKATPGFALPARWVIHTVGPIHQPGTDQAHLLRSCYTSSLAVADELGATSVAFPLISAGIYGWPLDDAIRQALTALRGADTNVVEARLVLFGSPTFTAAQRINADG